MQSRTPTRRMVLPITEAKSVGQRGPLAPNSEYYCPLNFDGLVHVFVWEKIGLTLRRESALLVIFAAAKLKRQPNHGQKYTFSRTADTGSAVKLPKQGKNSSDQPRWRRWTLRKEVQCMVLPGCNALCSHLPLRLPARNHLSHNDGVPQTTASGHQFIIHKM